MTPIQIQIWSTIMTMKKGKNKQARRQKQPQLVEAEYHEASALGDSSKVAKISVVLVSFGALLLLSTHSTIFADASHDAADHQQELDCDFYMAPSTIAENSGWGIFSAKAIEPGLPVLPSDVVVQLTDPRVKNDQYSLLTTMLRDYAWYPETTGGQFEATVAGAGHSISPGIGMLANGHPTHWNVVPDQPRMILNSNRYSYPGAGASSTYHSMQYYSYTGIEAGQEIVVNYGRGWDNRIDADAPPSTPSTSRSLDDLKENGWCLDHLVPRTVGPDDSGVGAYANRNLPSGTVIAPMPVRPLTRASLMTSSNNKTPSPSLLLNYCLGHEKSPILLYPYGPVVSLVNHDNDQRPNAVFRLAIPNDPTSISLDMLKHNSKQHPLLLELVTIRDITAGEEVTVDYGQDWVMAWRNHVDSWKPPVPDKAAYVYAEQFNQDIHAEVIKTISEQATDPYPSNLQTACYTKHIIDSLDQTYHQIQYPSDARTVGRPHPSQLQPCRVVTRDDSTNMYKVELPSTERQKSASSVVASSIVIHGVPRAAIRLVDKPGTTDQHLPNAFRHEIGLGDVFPEHWKDR